MSLSSQTQSLESLEEEERTEGIQGWAEVSQELRAHFDCERDFAKCLTEDEAMVPLRRAGEAGEFARFNPVELALMKVSVCA